MCISNSHIWHMLNFTIYFPAFVLAFSYEASSVFFFFFFLVGGKNLMKVRKKKTAKLWTFHEVSWSPLQQTTKIRHQGKLSNQEASCNVERDAELSRELGKTAQTSIISSALHIWSLREWLKEIHFWESLTSSHACSQEPKSKVKRTWKHSKGRMLC